MMSEFITLSMQFAYKNTDFTRTYELEGLSAAALSSVESKIISINDSLSAGTDGGLKDFFISDDFDATQDKGTLIGIKAASTRITTETYIFGGQ